MAYRASTEIGWPTARRSWRRPRQLHAVQRTLRHRGRPLRLRAVRGRKAGHARRAHRSQPSRPAAAGLPLAPGRQHDRVVEQPNRLMQLDLAAEAVAPTLRQTVDLPPVDDAAATAPALLTARGARRHLPGRIRTVTLGVQTRCTPCAAAARRRLSAARMRTPRWRSPNSAPTVRARYALYRRSSDTCGTAAVVVSNADGSQQSYDVAAPGRRPVPRFCTCGGRSRTPWRSAWRRGNAIPPARTHRECGSSGPTVSSR